MVGEQGRHESPRPAQDPATVETQHGDPRYLDVARKALADLRRLWGLDAPTKLDVRATRNPYDDFTDAALDAELAHHQQLLAASTLLVPPPAPVREEDSDDDD